jgi:hypothetical protein
MTMNTTRTTLRQALPRWQRGIVRAVLLMGALAGMTLGSTAHAQIAFRSSSFASIPGGGAAIPTLRAAIAGGPPMTIVGESRMPASDDAITTAASATIVPPPGMQNKDVILLFVSAMVPSSTSIANTVSGGQTWGWSIGTQIGSNPIQKVFKTIFNGTWTANPTFSWGATPATYQMWMIVLRGADTLTAGTQPVNDANCCSGANPDYLSGTFLATLPAPFDVTIPGTFTTSTDNAMVFAQWMSADDNTWALQNAPGWSQPGGQPQWRTMAAAGGAGADSSLSIAYFTQATAGPVAAVTNRQATLGGDAGAYRLFAMRPGGIRKPPGTVAGDVMIASIAFGLNTNVVTPPAGWTLVRRIDQASGTAYSLVIYRRVADASDASVSSYVFGLSNPNNGWVGGIQSFSGVDTTTPIDVENGQLTASALTHATPSVTTTGANRLIVTTHMVWNGLVTGWTAPAGMTETLDFRWGKGLIGAVATSNVLQATAGATGIKTATIAGATGYTGAAHILALRPAAGGGGSTTLTINKPAGVVQNDVMIASISVGPSTATITPPAGWTLVRRTDQATGTSNSLAVYKLLAGAAEPASYDWTFSAGHTGAAGGIMAFSGADPVLVETDSGVNTASGTAHATPSLTTGLYNTMIITSHSVGVSTATTWNYPVGMTEAVDANGGSAALEMNYVLQAVAGASGTKSATSSTTATGNAHILALRRVLGNFNAFETSTAAGATGGVIKTKIAGGTVTLATISKNAASNAVATTFVGTAKVEVLNASDNSGALDAVTGCRSTWTLIQALSPDTTFAAADNGRKNISFSVPNSYPEMRLRMTSPPAGGPDVIIGCSSDAFAIRPSSITVSAIDATWATAGNTRTLNNTAASGGTVHKAGSPFRITAAAQPVTATLYAGTPTVKTATCLLLGTMTGCANGTFTLPGGAWSGAGTRTNDSATHSEVGALTLELEDQNFAIVDAADSTTAERFIPQTGGTTQVGRFVPDRFVVAPANTPKFRTFGAACASRSFTYVGQSFDYAPTWTPVALVTAQNAAGGTTANYRESLWKITTVTQAYSNAVGPTLDASQATNAPTVTPANNGTGTVTVSTLDRIAHTRPASPMAPFNANISLTITVRDDSETDGQITTLTATPFSSIGFDSGSAFRFGRLALRHANGSQLVRLPVPLETQYWNGTVFVTNDADNCTTLATNNAAMSNFTGNLAACETANTAVSAFNRGRSILTLAAPGSGNTGSVDLAVNLSAAISGTTCTSVGGGTVPAAGANRAYLQGNWTGGAYNVNPSARATFGVYKGSDEVIFIRENF